jgi:hypothetical protein
VLVRLNLLRFEGRNRAVPDEIVQLIDRPGDDAVGFVPGRTLPQHGFAHPADQEGAHQRRLGVVKQQVAMKLPIARQRVAKDQVEDSLRLIGVAKCPGRLSQLCETIAQRPLECPPGRSLRLVASNQLKRLIQVGEKLNIGRARGEVEISKDLIEDGIAPDAHFSIAHGSDSNPLKPIFAGAKNRDSCRQPRPGNVWRIAPGSICRRPGASRLPVQKPPLTNSAW